MKTSTFAIALLLTASAAVANEMFDVAPTSYVIAGKDIDGNDAYSISVQLDREKGETRIKSLEVTIYGETLAITADILRQANNPDIGRISVINDAGVFGSYIYVQVPFGPPGKCHEARQLNLTKQIHITNLVRAGSKQLEASVYDPCKKP